MSSHCFDLSGWAIREADIRRLNKDRAAYVVEKPTRTLLTNNLLSSVSATLWSLCGGKKKSWSKSAWLVALDLSHNAISTPSLLGSGGDDDFGSPPSSPPVSPPSSPPRAQLAAYPRSVDKLRALGARFARLSTLVLSGNPLSAVPLEVLYLPQLEQLVLDDCQLTSLCFAGSAQLSEPHTALAQLSAKGNAIASVSAQLCALLPRLQVLLLDDNRLSQLPDLSALLCLHTLSLRANDLAHVAAADLLALLPPSLHSLDLSSNRITCPATASPRCHVDNDDDTDEQEDAPLHIDWSHNPLGCDGATPLLRLPDHVIAVCLSYLDAHDLQCSVAFVCRRFLRVVASMERWLPAIDAPVIPQLCQSDLALAEQLDGHVSACIAAPLTNTATIFWRQHPSIISCHDLWAGYFRDALTRLDSDAGALRAFAQWLTCGRWAPFDPQLALECTAALYDIDVDSALDDVRQQCIDFISAELRTAQRVTVADIVRQTSAPPTSLLSSPDSSALSSLSTPSFAAPSSTATSPPSSSASSSSTNSSSTSSSSTSSSSSSSQSSSSSLSIAIPSTGTTQSDRDTSSEPTKLSKSVGAALVNCAFHHTFSITDVPPKTLAQQMWLIDVEYQRRIRPFELCHRYWLSASRRLTSPNVLAVVQRYSHLSLWIASQILVGHAHSTPLQRATTLSYFIQLGVENWKLRNFAALFGVVGALEHSAIRRLRDTKAALSKKCFKQLTRLVEATDATHNFARYFAELEKCQDGQGRICFIGAHIDEILRCTEAVPSIADFGSATAHINFSKLRRMEQHFASLTRVPARSYRPVPFLVELLTNFRGIMASPKLFVLSKELES